MATEIVANEQPHGPYHHDCLRDAWEDVPIPYHLKDNMADLHRAITGVRELTRLLAEDDNGREQMEDGVPYTPMTFVRRWGINQAIRRLLHDAEFQIENLPGEIKTIAEG